jgi:L-ascorbate metabolism protein UlaG (beta-lactamase superfamily)
MKLRWLGTAGFQVDTGNNVFLIDPYLSRNPLATPAQNLKPADIAGAGQIFISHGHFDHLFDVPDLIRQGQAGVYCSEIAAASLVREGVDSHRIKPVSTDGYEVDFGDYQARAFFSRHVKFDIPLVVRTLLRVGAGGYRRISTISKAYPPGQVLSWRFTFNGYTMHHFGSGGSTPEELARVAALPLDLLLVPLQGHTHICDIAFEYVRLLKPRMVIPHHQDDFYPPLSVMVDIEPFVRKVKAQCPDTEVRVMDMNETINL